MILDRKHISKGIKVLFAFLAVGFTGISAVNGLHFYRVIFGLHMALMITGVFEIARLACLFRFVNRGSRAELLSIIIYGAVAATCAFASVNSFSSRVIFQNFAGEKEQRQQIQKIKQVYSEKMEKRLEERRRDIRYIENIIAKGGQGDKGKGYWEKRLSQIKANYHDLITERDRFLNREPENPHRWIKANAAVLDVKLDSLSEVSRELRSTASALKQLWGLEKESAQKLVGAVLTGVVELSILLLAFLSAGEKSAKMTAKKRGKSCRTVRGKITLGDVDKKNLEKFVKVSRDYFRRTGKLPPQRKLSPNLRKVRKAMGNLEQDKLEKIFEE